MILMRNNFNDIEFLSSKNINFEDYMKQSYLDPFSDIIINFLDSLSKELINNERSRDYPDVITFAFFCRRANINSLKRKYYKKDELRLGRGIVFHIAPSNVPVNFAYSLISGLLSGNINIVRVPSKNFEQVAIISNVIKSLMQKPEYKMISNFITLVRYDRSSNLTSFFSSISDVRIIWGGDDTISQIRENKIPPRSFDLTFADRYSFCMINADQYIKTSKPKKIAELFFNDTYLFDQNACTSPHLLIWTGTKKNVLKAKKIFWDTLHILIKEKYAIQPIVAVDKLTSFYSQSIIINKTSKEPSEDNLIWRVNISELPNNIDNHRCTSGYFNEYYAPSILEIKNIVNRKYQTLSYYGYKIDEMKKIMEKLKPIGIDRIVPIGKTTDFSLTWDGYNLIDTLSRKIDLI